MPLQSSEGAQTLTQRRREMFSIVKAHLLKQRKRCLSRFGLCVYKNEEGLACAVGVLLDAKPNEFDPFDGLDSKAVQTRLVEKGWPSDKESLSLLADLQEIHDLVEPNHWEGRLNVIEKLN